MRGMGAGERVVGMWTRRLGRILGWGGWVLSVACAGSAPALTEKRRALASEDEVSELLGLSLRQALGDRAGVTQLTWGENREGLEFSPNASTTELRWALTVPEPGSKGFRIDQVAVECDAHVLATNPHLCDDRLEASLLLHLETGDGALAGDLRVVSRVYAPDDVSWLNSDVNIGAMAGSFGIVVRDAEMGSLRLSVSGRLTPGGSAGVLLGDVVTMQRGMDMMDMMMSWPSDGPMVTVAEWGAAVESASPSP